MATRAPDFRTSISNSSKVRLDRGARCFRGKALAPIFHAEPVAEFRRIPLAPFDADHSDRRVVILDQEHGFALLACDAAHEIDRVILRIGMRQTGILRNAAIIGERRDCFYVRERRPAQQQPFGLEDAATSSRNVGVWISCSMSGSFKR